MQALPLEVKIEKSKQRIKEWYEAFDGQVYVSFSGGKDSTVLLHLVRSMYPDAPAVFVDTGLEYPEIKEFVRTVENVTWLHPKYRKVKASFRWVIEKYGYPVVSKEHSFRVRKLRHQNLTDDYRQKQMVRLGGWKTLLNAPFECSEQCCNVMKKTPCKAYEKETQRAMFTGEMADDGMGRLQQYINNGCNAFDLKRPKSTPLGFWTEQDIWDYIHQKVVPYSRIYDMGEDRTGCMFCMFGCHLEGTPNRFQRMKKTHPQLYNYCMKPWSEGGLGLASVLDFIKVPYGDYYEQMDIFRRI
jgi:3'-phosphoadenosine 5'-phosphosulfate sulfotransferase (PAPS reductase)/FAD synthetase